MRGCPRRQFEPGWPADVVTPLVPPDSLLRKYSKLHNKRAPRKRCPSFIQYVKFQFSELLVYTYFSCFGKKSTKRSRVKGRFGQMRPLYNPPPHRHPAFKNVPIFERLHFVYPQVCTAEPAENRDIFSGRWSLRREWGPGRGWCSAQRI